VSNDRVDNSQKDKSWLRSEIYKKYHFDFQFAQPLLTNLLFEVLDLIAITIAARIYTSKRKAEISGW